MLVTNFAVFQAVIICIVKLRTALDTLVIIRERARARPRFLFAVLSIFETTFFLFYAFFIRHVYQIALGAFCRTVYDCDVIFGLSRDCDGVLEHPWRTFLDLLVHVLPIVRKELRVEHRIGSVVVQFLARARALGQGLALRTRSFEEVWGIGPVLYDQVRAWGCPALVEPRFGEIERERAEDLDLVVLADVRVVFRHERAVVRVVTRDSIAPIHVVHRLVADG